MSMEFKYCDLPQSKVYTLQQQQQPSVTIKYMSLLNYTVVHAHLIYITMRMHVRICMFVVWDDDACTHTTCHLLMIVVFIVCLFCNILRYRSCYIGLGQNKAWSRDDRLVVSG